MARRSPKLLLEPKPLVWPPECARTRCMIAPARCRRGLGGGGIVDRWGDKDGARSLWLTLEWRGLNPLSSVMIGGGRGGAEERLLSSWACGGPSLDVGEVGGMWIVG